jgi:hypothetical protein
LAAIFARLEFAGLLYLARFAGERPSKNSRKFEYTMSVHRSGMGLASSGIYQRKTATNSAAASKPPLRKRKFDDG